jgi:hypothetical protein
MSYLVLLDVAKAQQEERIRQVEKNRMLSTVLRESERPSTLMSLVQALRRR